MRSLPLLFFVGLTGTVQAQELSTVIASMSMPLAYMRACEAQYGKLRPGIVEMLREEAVKLGHDPNSLGFQQALANETEVSAIALSGQNQELWCTMLKDRLDSFPR
ncbi:MAG: hypothetical protein DI537_30935 [Stutzerimonas stutzeri]|nr:MAG: hypothetical protein DI537_30935 [Stutzerimonas stutzeri]